MLLNAGRGEVSLRLKPCIHPDESIIETGNALLLSSFYRHIIVCDINQNPTILNLLSGKRVQCESRYIHANSINKIGKIWKLHIILQ